MSAVDQVKALVDAAESKLESDIGSLIDQANAVGVSLQSQVDTLTAQASDLKVQITDLTSKLNAASDHVTTLTGEGAQKDAEIALQKTQIDSAAAQVSDLTTQITGLNGDVRTRDAKISDLQGQIFADAATLSALNAQIADLENQITAVKAQVADLTAQLAVAKVASTPPPPPPAGFTVNLQNMTEVRPGVYGSTNLGASKSSGGQVAVVQAQLAKAVQGGQTLIAEYDQTTNVVPDGKKNIKDWRTWVGSSGAQPDEYTGRSLGAGDHSITAENGDGVVLYHSSHPNGWTVAYFPMPIKADVKQHIKRTTKYSSAPGQADGYVKIEVDGAVAFESAGFIVNPGRSMVDVQMVYAPNSGDSGPLPAGSYFQVENLKITVS